MTVGHQILLTAAWAQVAGAFVAGLAFCAAGLFGLRWLRRRRAAAKPKAGRV
jgi:hypothetical protein